MNKALSRSLAAAACAAALAGASACGGAAAAHPGGQAASVISRADRSWIGQAHLANEAEISVGSLAEKVGATAAIRSAGRMLHDDHKALDRKLVSLASKLHLRLPGSLTPQQDTVSNRLDDETGRTFDHDFTESMLSAHQTMVAATRKEIARGSAPAIVALARQALPVLLRHLAMIKKDAAKG